MAEIKLDDTHKQLKLESNQDNEINRLSEKLNCLNLEKQNYKQYVKPVDEEYKKLFVYVNMFVILMSLYKNANKLIPLELREKKYNFSCLGGRVVREHRMFFLSEVFYRNYALNLY